MNKKRFEFIKSEGSIKVYLQLSIRKQVSTTSWLNLVIPADYALL